MVMKKFAITSANIVEEITATDRQVEFIWMLFEKWNKEDVDEALEEFDLSLDGLDNGQSLYDLSIEEASALIDMLNVRK